MAFTISGFNGTGIKTETRLIAASAMVLASRWERAGFEEVTIKDGEREPETIEQIRRRLHHRPKSSNELHDSMRA